MGAFYLGQSKTYRLASWIDKTPLWSTWTSCPEKIYDDKHVSISILKFGKKESIRLLQWIYYKKDLPCLLRKREIADKFLLRA